MRRGDGGGARRWARRIVVGLSLLLALVFLTAWYFLRGSLPLLDGRRTVAGLHGVVSVARDARGVPSIAGNHREDVAYATGFVHAQDRFFQMDLLRRMAAGELAELFGAKALPLDRAHRLHRFRARAATAWLTLPPADRQLLERYTAGVNDGLNALGTRPFEYGLLRMQPRAWSAHDTLLAIFAMYLDLQGNATARELSRGWLREHADPAQLAFLLPTASRWDAPLDAADIALAKAPVPDRAPAWWGKAAPSDPALLALDDTVSSIGSNNWAVAGGRSQGGGAIVSDDMHLGIKLPNTWYRALLQVPDGNGSTRRLVGVSLPGAPFIIVGTNGHVAWAFTNSYGDYQDLVTAQLDAAHPGQVRLNGQWEKIVEHAETILVKDAPAETLKVRDTSLGPLMEAGGRTYAVHWIAHETALVNVNLRKLEGANTLDEALAIASTAGIPAQNFVAGDAAGNIGWTIAGPLPRRTGKGDGPTDATFPLADGAAGWQGWLAPAEYPRVVNPAGGQLVTANSRQLAGAGAALLGDGGFDLGARTRQARDALTALGPHTDERAVYGVMLDDRALYMAGWRDRALAVLDQAALAGQPKRAEAARLLRENWTGRASPDAAGYRIARGFMWSLYELLYGGANVPMQALASGAGAAAAERRWPEVVARLLDEQPAGWLPRQYDSWRALQLAALDRTVADLEADGTALRDATWGARNRAAIAHPLAQAVPALRQWLSAPADPLPGDNHMPRVSGRTYGQSQRLTVSPGKEEQGVFNMPGGQSGHPLSPYFLAGHAEWVAGTPTPLLPGPVEHTLAFMP
ncbi:penicillin acylase family protein [Pseudoduganella chitinolytica]|uniref:Penicillin acylase family protein n=1 Tax=Pseudoduganella chitinolytica TaxID=34070 RepID=A0ABY8BDE5_9BURK|nr:penicillin acylase family protein [Pseudoduganella chitinolytica]WEF33935.1 penicillin acylase family protein [Pseudoduganella chitinolytica]